MMLRIRVPCLPLNIILKNSLKFYEWIMEFRACVDLAGPLVQQELWKEPGNIRI
jgi:hypothetical protein